MKHTTKAMDMTTSMMTRTTTTSRSLMVLTWCALLAPACTGGEVHTQLDANQSSGDTDAGHDATHDDTHDASPGLDAGTDTGPVCVPATECPVDACGMVDDGYGGTLECTPCECVDGELTIEPTCGTCGLGVRTCAPGATGASTCEGPEASDLGFAPDAELDCATQLVYLDPNRQEPGSGTRDEPMADLARAYQLARERSIGEDATQPIRVLVVAAQGELTHTDGLRLRQGVSLIGGFARGENGSWTWDASGAGRTTVQIARGGNQSSVVGLIAPEVTEPTLISRLEVLVDDARDNVERFSGGSSIGLWARSSPGLTVTHSRFVAGKGGAGGEGTSGRDGAPGVAGGGGVFGTNYRVLSNPQRPAAGAGGVNPDCLGFYGLSDGGSGGRGGGACTQGMMGPCEHYLASWVGSTPPEAGEQGFGFGGGQGGMFLNPGRNRYSATVTASASSGAPGTPRDPGTDGAGARAGGRADLGTYWDSEGVGEDGAHGRNGGGGGGGGAVEYIYYNDTDWFFGPGGAGGGSGGCGGGFGEGGGAGGASVGAVLVDSDLTLEHVELEVSSGGRGGDGGAGGKGGEGGAGGIGISMLSGYGNFGEAAGPPNSVDGFASSGDGGQGARGSDGGHGGGGAGGASYGLYCDPDSAPTLVSVDAQTAGNSEGGGGPGQPGERGLGQRIVGCP